ncbi:iron ABC transporter substrate-binding protein [Demequina sp. B12]|uniref:iron ABC transporter substrate-binding protein n=1 Tax=Demequina sp. B12 TaxID=2992757 RepID=UPI00237B01EF|nr:iron ABC transporter substrate-binding protein [Demequina sp. B12]MDE0571955.1 iron ABC transporter substrate-binding protein [Demequina sp. B12]
MRRMIVGIAGLSVLAAAGCSTAESETTSGTESTDSATAAATADATVSDNAVVLYSGRDEELVGPLVEQFTAETGIEVEVRYGSTGEIAALLTEEGDATPADVFLSQDAGALGALTSQGMSATLPDAITSTVPAGFTSTDDTWVGVTGRARVIAYDSDVLDADAVPTSVDELTDPMWDGKIAFPPGNASFQSFITALRVLEGEEAADAWVEGIAANNPQFTEKNSAALELVNTGAAELALINHYYWYRAAAEVGEENMRAQLAFLPGDAGGIVNVTGAALLQTAADDADAVALIEYLVSEAGQQYFVDATYEYPLVEGVDAPEGLPALDELVNPNLDLSDLESLDATQELLAAYGLI